MSWPVVRPGCDLGLQGSTATTGDAGDARGAGFAFFFTGPAVYPFDAVYSGPAVYPFDAVYSGPAVYPFDAVYSGPAVSDEPSILALSRFSVGDTFA